MKEKEEKNLRFVLDHYRKGVFNTSEAISAFRRRTSGEKSSPRAVRLYAALTAAVVAAAVVLTVFFSITPVFRTMETLTADAVMTVCLPDSTFVTLSPNSSISYIKGKPFTLRRKVKITGKAYFSVARDTEHPFEVMAGNSYIKVLGTRFHVDGCDDSTDLYVLSGKVFFAESADSEDSEGLFLTKGMSARYTAGSGKPEFSKSDVLNPAAWATGVFEYDSAPLEEVLSELSHFYGRNFILVSSGSLQKKNLTGRFFADDMESVIFAIEEALDVKIEVK